MAAHPAPLARRYRFSAAEVLRMSAAGLFDDDDRTVELLDGELIEMPRADSPEHVMCVARLTHWAVNGLRPAQGLVLVQSSVQVGEYSLPRPDLTIVRPQDYQRLKRLPREHEALLVVEVGVTSVVSDRREKLPIYAAAGVREVWLIDLPGGKVRVCRKPQPGRRRYAAQTTRRRGDVLAVEALPELTLSVDELLGPQG